MQSLNRAHFLNSTSLSLLFQFATESGTDAIDIIPLTRIYASL